MGRGWGFRILDPEGRGEEGWGEGLHIRIMKKGLTPDLLGLGEGGGGPPTEGRGALAGREGDCRGETGAGA